MNITDAILDNFTIKNYINEYEEYKSIKTDMLSDELTIKLMVGVDGLNQKHFDKRKEKIAESVCKRIAEGNYFFHPYREIDIPKEPNMTLKEAYKADTIRTLSVASIRDVVSQRLIYKAIDPFFEEVFNKVPTVSFAYRSGFSAPQACRRIKRYIDEGYLYVLDADIKRFFDSIPHITLENCIKKLITNDDFVISLLRRAYAADRVPHRTYRGNARIFYKKKPRRIRRTEGIPQGGVLSGLLANLYLHPFDLFVRSLQRQYDIKYVRYADDFVILSKDKKNIPKLKQEVDSNLTQIGLTLHPDNKKTKTLNLRHDQLNFVGFKISPKTIRVQEKNIYRFKSRIEKIIQNVKVWEPKTSEEFLVNRINTKLLGNEAIMKVCPACHAVQTPRSWMAFFSTVTDVRQIRSLDIWIRKLIYRRFKQCDYPIEGPIRDITSLERLYFRFRKELRNDMEFCKCTKSEQINAIGEGQALIEMES